MDKKFKIFVIVAMIALAALAGTGTVVALSIVNGESSQAQESYENKNLVTMALKEPITANLVGDERKKSIARVSIGLGVDAKQKGYKEFNSNFDSSQLVIRDEIINILRKQTYEQMTKSDAQDELAKEIKKQINQLMETEVIKEVYFGEFFVQ
ncbi:MAG: flagellar basal body-associated FliL family protein [Cellulosilyticaceae bacterium]